MVILIAVNNSSRIFNCFDEISPREIVYKHETTRGEDNRGESPTYGVGRYHLHDGGCGPYNIILLLLCTFMCVQMLVRVPMALWTIIARVII